MVSMTTVSFYMVTVYTPTFGLVTAVFGGFTPPPSAPTLFIYPSAPPHRLCGCRLQRHVGSLAQPWRALVIRAWLVSHAGRGARNDDRAQSGLAALLRV